MQGIEFLNKTGLVVGAQNQSLSSVALSCFQYYSRSRVVLETNYASPGAEEKLCSLIVAGSSLPHGWPLICTSSVRATPVPPGLVLWRLQPQQERFRRTRFNACLNSLVLKK